MIKGYKDLDIWKKAMRLTSLMYDITAKFPKEETYGLASQMRRAAVSIPSNVAEGSMRGSTSEFIQFITIARGSLAELETQLLIAYERGYVAKECYSQAMRLMEDITYMFIKLLQSLKIRKSTQHAARNT